MIRRLFNGGLPIVVGAGGSTDLSISSSSSSPSTSGIAGGGVTGIAVAE